MDSPSSPQSIQYLSRYLELDMSKIFKGPVPQHLLAKVERSNLRVELCFQCSRLNDKLMNLFEQLEKVEMEISFRLESVLEKVGDSSQTVTKFEKIRINFRCHHKHFTKSKIRFLSIRSELLYSCKDKTLTSFSVSVLISLLQL